MIDRLPDSASRLLRRGVLCYLASPHAAGPHLTPLVYALHGSRLWVTTSRRSVKARAWKRDDLVGGMVRLDDRAVSFVGRVLTYDLLEPGSWGRSVVHAPSLTRAATAFTAKNARFFAGYAVDAYRIPLAWTPPGRVFAEIRIDRLALIQGADVERTWGRFRGQLASAESFRATRTGSDPLSHAPRDVRDRVGDAGDGALAVQSGRTPVVFPCRWALIDAVLYAVAPMDVLALGGEGPDAPVGLTVDHASTWRARAMAGLLVQGEGRVHDVRRLHAGARSAAAVAEGAGVDPSNAAVVRIRPRRLVWWRGWDSGTVRIAGGRGPHE